MKNILYLLFLGLVCSLTAQASDMAYLKYGLGISAPNQSSISDIKLIAIGKQYDFNIIDSRLEFGGWADNTRNKGSLNGGYGTFMLGLDPKIDSIIYMNWFSGIGLITNPDSLLGSHFQFFHDFGIGIRDGNKVSVGLYYKHLSNAGLTDINRGRDFFGVHLGIPW